MKHSSFVALVVSMCITFLVAAQPGAWAAADASIGPAAVADVDHDVIVILRDQVPSLPAVSDNRAARRAVLAASQAPLIATLQQSRSRVTHSFAMINAFATRMTTAEAQSLSAHPEVLGVIADRVIRMPKRKGLRALAGASSAAVKAQYSSTTPSGPLCDTLEPEALQLMNAAYLDRSVPQAQEVTDGNGYPVTGRGVKVAFIADGLDIHNPGFVRPDGSSVFFDYEDFSGDPAGTATDGGEAFGDASSIAAQDTPHGKPLLFDISQYTAPTPLPSPCNIRIRGVAPGASLVGLKAFSDLDYSTTSSLVQAIEYAVLIDDVDVINESFGYNPYFDSSLDPVSLADEAAVRAGVTVVASTGDSGSAGTLGSPATDPYVIAAGASTQFRLYSQIYDGVAILTKGGWVSDNVSAISSSGFAQRDARTVDVLAPGDLGWALCSLNATLYTDCTSYLGAPTSVQAFGGTSEASPLTAATAALVIQAYRSTHGGKNPSPALVKQIIMSSAHDVAAPAFEQGAGLVDALAAVHAALAVKDDHGNPKPAGTGVLLSQNAVSIEALPNNRESTSLTVTNTGTAAQHLVLALQTLGKPFAGETLTVNLNASTDPSFFPQDQAPYVNQTFVVPPGADHLDAAFAWPATVPLVFVSLIDPSGRQAAYSIPQGLGSAYGHVDVVKPQAGKWIANFSTFNPNSPLAYTGPIQFTWGVEKYVDFGSVRPTALDLAPGASSGVTAYFSMPAQPGDVAMALRLASTNRASGSYPDVPVTLRTDIPIGPTGGEFSGTLTGGNGRSFSGPAQTYAFDVPSHIGDMSLTLVTPDSGYALEGFLIDPNGMQLSVGANLDPAGAQQYGLSQFRFNPQPGHWHFVLLQNYFSSGNQTSLPFEARIGFNTAKVTASGLPDSPSVHLSSSAKPLVVPIKVTNTGAIAAAFFVDARLSRPAAISLSASDQAPVAEAQGLCLNGAGTAYSALPGVCYQITVPTETSGIQFYATTSQAPLTMDVQYDAGYNDQGTGSGIASGPDLFSRRLDATTIVASLLVPFVPWGPWITTPSETGPYSSHGAPAVKLRVTSVATMLPFDSAALADSGDVWADLVQGTQTFSPLVLAAGEQGTIHLAITPDSKHAGEVVEGYVFIDTYNPLTLTGDEVVRIPYQYTVEK